VTYRSAAMSPPVRIIGSLLLTMATHCLAASAAPAVGNIGFDWLRPDSARCEVISESLRKRFRRCEYTGTGAFGLSDPLHVCRVSDRSEYMIFQTRSACVKNLETMKANAP
jgi:hypothetical protein